MPAAVSPILRDGPVSRTAFASPFETPFGLLGARSFLEAEQEPHPEPGRRPESKEGQPAIRSEREAF